MNPCPARLNLADGTTVACRLPHGPMFSGPNSMHGSRFMDSNEQPPVMWFDVTPGAWRQEGTYDTTRLAGDGS